MNSLYWQTALLLAGAYFAGAILSCLVRKLIPSDRRSDYDASTDASVAATPDAGQIAPIPVPSPQAGATLATHGGAGEEIVTISHGRERAQEIAETSFEAGKARVVEPPAQRASLSGAEITKRSPSLSDEIAASERAKQFERSLSGEGISSATIDEPIAPTPSASPDVEAPAPVSAASMEPGPVSGDTVGAAAALAGAAALAAAASVATTAENLDQGSPEAGVAKHTTTAEIDVAARSTEIGAVPGSDAVVPIAPVAIAPAAVAVPTTAAGPDDLKSIDAIDAGIEQELNENGITRYSDIAGWTASDVGHANAALGTTGRVQKENWIEQAQILASGGSTAYSRQRQLQSAGQIGGVVPAPAVAAASAAAASPELVAPVSPLAVAPPEPDPPEPDPPEPDPPEPDPVVTAAPASALPTAPSADAIVSSEGAPQPLADASENAVAGATTVSSADAHVDETRSPSLAATAAKAAAAVAGAAAIAHSAREASSAPEPHAPDVSAIIPSDTMIPSEPLPPVQVSTDTATTQSVPESTAQQSDGADSNQTTINPVAAAAAAATAATAATAAAIAGAQQPASPDPQPPTETQSHADREPWPEREARPEQKELREARPERKELREARGEQEPRNASLQGMRSVRSEAYRTSAALASATSSARVLSSEYDDLKRVRGIGVMIERRLNALGITSYEQMANWSADDVARISQALDFKGRIERENWIEQARILGAGGYTEFSSRVDRGEVDSSKDRG